MNTNELSLALILVLGSGCAPSAKVDAVDDDADAETFDPTLGPDASSSSSTGPMSSETGSTGGMSGTDTQAASSSSSSGEPASDLAVTLLLDGDGTPESVKDGGYHELEAAISNAEGPVTVTLWHGDDLLAEFSEEPYVYEVLYTSVDTGQQAYTVSVSDGSAEAADDLEVSVNIVGGVVEKVAQLPVYLSSYRPSDFGFVVPFIGSAQDVGYVAGNVEGEPAQVLFFDDELDVLAEVGLQGSVHGAPVVAGDELLVGTAVSGNWWVSRVSLDGFKLVDSWMIGPAPEAAGDFGPTLGLTDAGLWVSTSTATLGLYSPEGVPEGTVFSVEEGQITAVAGAGEDLWVVHGDAYNALAETCAAGTDFCLDRIVGGESQVSVGLNPSLAGLHRISVGGNDDVYFGSTMFLSESGAVRTGRIRQDGMLLDELTYGGFNDASDGDWLFGVAADSRGGFLICGRQPAPAPGADTAIVRATDGALEGLWTADNIAEGNSAALGCTSIAGDGFALLSQSLPGQPQNALLARISL